MLKEKLQEFGFSEKEAKVYLALAEMGSAVVSDIAKKAGVNRSTTYVILESLVERGLVSITDRQGVRRYNSAPPGQLVLYLKGMAERYADLAKTAKEILPELPSPSVSGASSPKVQFFEGEKGIKTAYEDTLATLEEIRVHAAFGRGERSAAGSIAVPIKKRGVKMQIVFPAKSGKGKRVKSEPDALREILLESRAKGGSSSEISVYDDRVVFISTAEDFALVVESRELADALRKAFAVPSQEKEDTKRAALRPAFAS